MNADKNNELSLRGAATRRRSNPRPLPTLPLARGGLGRDGLLLAILLLAFALRVWNAGSLLMWGDEGFSVYSANHSLYTITFEGKDVDPHPPLYYYLLHFWLPLGGYSEFSVRFFSVFFGTATVALAFALGKRLFDARVGLLASALMAIAPFAIHYSQEVRMYALVIFLAALALWFFVRLVRVHTSNFQPPTSNFQLWLGFWVAMFLTQYSLYQSAFLFVAQGLTLLPLLKSHFWFVARWLAASVSIVVLFLPWLALHSSSAFEDVKGVAGDTRPMDIATFLGRGFAGLLLDPTTPLASSQLPAALFALVIAVGLGIAIFTRTAKLADGMLAWSVAIPMLAMYPLYILLPLYRGRLFALALVPLMLLVARAFGLLAQRTRWLSVPVALAMLAAMAFGLNQYYFRYNRYSAVVDDYIPAIRAIEKIAQPGDVVLFHAYWQEGYFLSHHTGAPLTYGSLEKQTDLQNAVAQPRNVWAIVQAIPHHAAEDWLAQNAFALAETQFGQMRVIQYRADPQPAVALPTPIVFNNGITLNGARIESNDTRASVRLDWQAAQKPARDFTVSVRVTDARDENVIWAQADEQPANGTLATSSWEASQVVADRHTIAIPAGMPPGEYAVRVMLYDSQTGAPAFIVAPDNARGQVALIGAMTIQRGAPLANAPQVLRDMSWGDLALIEAKVGASDIVPGDALPLTLVWRTLQTPTRDVTTTIEIVDASGKIRATRMYRPANDSFTTRAWRAGETWLDAMRLNVEAESASGQATVRVSVDGRAFVVARVMIHARPHRFDLPTPWFAKRATLGDRIQLLGYDLPENPLQVNATIPLILYWQASDKIETRYKEFAHLLDAQGNIVAQRDSEPDAGNAPTTSWLKGEVIADTLNLVVPEKFAPGEYTLIVGMYSASTGQRLPVVNTNADHLVLAKFRLGQ
ncbi:MAG: glycosyltransferase family 39 protein [Chloroflexi bacterium]|nr:glycosyltransferase family 39 protein [Chloroflexota bacterium]